jgi:hypothetical protein
VQAIDFSPQKHINVGWTMLTMAERSAFFVIRQHCSLGWKEVSELTAVGQAETGDTFEQ